MRSLRMCDHRGGSEDRNVYYHCTSFRGRCGNTYVREEELSRLFEDVVRRVQIPAEVADWIAEALRESHDDKERFHRPAVMRLQQQYLSVQAKLDRAYEDRLDGKVSDEPGCGSRRSGRPNSNQSAAKRPDTRRRATTTP